MEVDGRNLKYGKENKTQQSLQQQIKVDKQINKS